MHYDAVGDDDGSDVGARKQLGAPLRREFDRDPPIDHDCAIVGFDGLLSGVEDNDDLGTSES